jgi:hypothetical protein
MEGPERAPPRRRKLLVLDEYGQFCPIAPGAEIFAQRWTPLILRELLLGSHTSVAARAAADLAESAGSAVSVPRGRRCDRASSAVRRAWPRLLPDPGGGGVASGGVCAGDVGYKWTAQQLRPECLDAGLLMWFLRRRVKAESLPDERLTVSLRFSRSGQAFGLARGGAVVLARAREAGGGVVPERSGF